MTPSPRAGPDPPPPAARDPAPTLEALGRLAGGVAHDFNNLLTIILGVSDLLLQDLPADDPQRAPLEQIRLAGERVEALTRQLLAFSRRQICQPEVLDWNAVVRQSEPLWRRVLREDITLVTRLAPEGAPVQADRGQLEQILLNLVANARDAMPQGGQCTLTIAAVTRTEPATIPGGTLPAGRYVRLTVSDTGVGMDAATQAQVFEPFFTTKAPGHGTGLGLATVYGIVRQHHGGVTVTSALGQGTTVRVDLPRATSAVSPARPPSSTGSPTGGTETILVVEDDPSVRACVAAILRQAGYTVLTAVDGEAALQQCHQHRGPIHCLLIDVVLPGQDGRACAAAVERHRPAVKVCYMSGYTDNVIVHRGVLAPGTVFLAKPIRPQTLLAKVRAVLTADAPPPA